MQKKKRNKQRNKTKQTRKKKKKKTPGANIQPYWPKKIGQYRIYYMPKTNSFLAGQAIIKTLTVPKESFIKRVDHTSTCIPILYKLQIHFNCEQNLLSFLHRWNTARNFLSEESCCKNTVHSAKTCMWPYTESLWWTGKHRKSANVLNKFLSDACQPEVMPFAF